MENEIIERTKIVLSPIKYEPHYPAYFVTLNGSDLGGSDFCKNCINKAVKDARKYHNERRSEIIKKHDNALKIGKYKVIDIVKSKRSQLKYYPAKASFTYEGHDPDFGGGLREPCLCDGCGEPFQCSFEADKEEAEHLLRIVESGELDEREKWEFDVALSNFKYLDQDVKKVLLKAASVFLLNK